MMWNLLIGGLLVGAPIVLFDGNPGHPDLGALWRLAERHRITVFGTSAPFLQACLKAGLRPGDEYDLGASARSAPPARRCRADGFRWIGDAVGAHIQICSVSGGTDVCTAFVGVGAERAGVAGGDLVRVARRARSWPTTRPARSSSTRSASW